MEYNKVYKNLIPRELLKANLAPNNTLSRIIIIKIIHPMIIDLIISLWNSFIFISFINSIYLPQFAKVCLALSNPQFGENRVSGLNFANKSIDFSTLEHIYFTSAPVHFAPPKSNSAFSKTTLGSSGANRLALK